MTKNELQEIENGCVRIAFNAVTSLTTEGVLPHSSNAWQIVALLSSTLLEKALSDAKVREVLLGGPGVHS